MFLFLLGVYLGVKMLGQTVILCLTFFCVCVFNILKCPWLFSGVAAPPYSPTSSSWWLQFLHIFQNICYLCFDCSYSSVYGVTSCVSVCLSLMTNGVLIGPLSVFVGEMVASGSVVWKLYYSFIRCYHWVTLAKGVQDLPILFLKLYVNIKLFQNNRLKNKKTSAYPSILVCRLMFK